MKFKYKLLILILEILLIGLIPLNISAKNVLAQSSTSSQSKMTSETVYLPLLNVTLQKNILVISAIIFIVGIILVLIPWAVVILIEKFSSSDQLTFESRNIKSEVGFGKYIQPIKKVTNAGGEFVQSLVKKNSQKIFKKQEKNKLVEP